MNYEFIGNSWCQRGRQVLRPGAVAGHVGPEPGPEPARRPQARRPRHPARRADLDRKETGCRHRQEHALAPDALEAVLFAHDPQLQHQLSLLALGEADFVVIEVLPGEGIED